LLICLASYLATKSTFIDDQKTKFSDLAVLFETYYKNPEAKLPEFISLPSLSQFPKPFYWRDLSNDYLVRKSVLQLFSEFWDWFKEKRNNEYGQYFAGPEGIGKSVAVYFCACLAYSLGWVVVYFANCEGNTMSLELLILEWIDSGSSGQSEELCEIFRLQYAVRVFENSLVNHYNQATNQLITSPYYGNTWGELISYGKKATSLSELQAIVGYLFNEIYEHQEHPVPLIADEVNAIYAKNMQDVRPYTICAKINGKRFNNGYKLLSGTGIILYFA
jgi:hypothetical protein